MKSPSPENTLIIVLAYHGAPCRALSLWLLDRDREGYAIDYGSSEHGIDIVRNQNCNRFLQLYPTHEYLVMFDRDMVPVTETMPLLTAPGDVVYCGGCGRGGSKGHFGPDDFGAAAMRVSRGALEAMPRPWFRFTWNEAHDRKIDCECNHFRRGAIAAGFVPQMVGVAGHVFTGVAVPDKDGKTRILSHEQAITCPASDTFQPL